MNIYKSKLINKLISVVPFNLVNQRHYFNNRKALKRWMDDDVFMFHIPKTGGTSIAKAMGRPEPGHQTFQRLLKKDPSIQNKRSYFFVSRDPVDRIVSTYKYINMLHAKYGTSTIPQAYYAETLDDFVVNYLAKIDVEKHYFLRSVTNIINGIDESKVWAINFNGLSDNFSRFCESQVNIKYELPHENVSIVNSDAVISERSRKIIVDIYKKDYEINQALGAQPFCKLSKLKTR